LNLADDVLIMLFLDLLQLQLKPRFLEGWIHHCTSFFLGFFNYQFFGKWTEEEQAEKLSEN
jgi:hypothetical protein